MRVKVESRKLAFLLASFASSVVNITEVVAAVSRSLEIERGGPSRLLVRFAISERVIPLAHPPELMRSHVARRLKSLAEGWMTGDC